MVPAIMPNISKVYAAKASLKILNVVPLDFPKEIIDLPPSRNPGKKSKNQKKLTMNRSNRDMALFSSVEQRLFDVLD